MKYYSRKIIICALLLSIFMLGISAATLGEMRENGEVSDGGISYGDERDGIVSDVSDNHSSMLPNSNGKDNSGKGTSNGGSVLGDIGSDVSRGVGDIGRDVSRGVGDMVRGATDNGNAGTDNGNATTGGGISAGLIIAILVVVAVLVIIFIMLPKRR